MRIANAFFANPRSAIRNPQSKNGFRRREVEVEVGSTREELNVASFSCLPFVPLEAQRQRAVSVDDACPFGLGDPVVAVVNNRSWRAAWGAGARCPGGQVAWGDGDPAQ